jgi:hypothetical protein
VVRSRPCAHAKRDGRRTAALKPASRRCALPIRPRIGQLAHGRSTRRRFCPCAPFQGAPSSSHLAAVQHLLAAPHGPYNLPVPPLFLPRPRGRRSRARRGQAPCTPSAGQLPAPLRPSPVTNRQQVSPSSFPTPSPVESPTGAAQFRPEPPPPWPRDYIASISLFPGCFS